MDDSGNVAFIAKGNSTPVTITATPKMGGAPLTYTFSVNAWFINNGSESLAWIDAFNWCSAQGMSQPTRYDMDGWLFWEWDNIANSGFIIDGTYWTSDRYAISDTALSNSSSDPPYYVVYKQDL